MTKYTIHDVGHIIPVEQTATVIKDIEAYLNTGVIPPFDPCLSCEPNHTRKLISLIQTAERTGLWPAKKAAAKPKPKANEPKADGKADEGGYTAGAISLDEMENIKTKRAEMFKDQ